MLALAGSPPELCIYISTLVPTVRRYGHLPVILSYKVCTSTILENSALPLYIFLLSVLHPPMGCATIVPVSSVGQSTRCRTPCSLCHACSSVCKLDPPLRRSLRLRNTCTRDLYTKAVLLYSCFATKSYRLNTLTAARKLHVNLLLVLVARPELAHADHEERGTKTVQ